MRDLRLKKTFSFDIDDELKNINDDQIIKNYIEALNLLWPNLIKINLISYDPWDDFSDSLFDHLVLKSFMYKYGLSNKELGLNNYSLGITKSSYITCYSKADIIRFDENQNRNYAKILKNDSVKVVGFSFPGIDLSVPADFLFSKYNDSDKLESLLKEPSDFNFSHAIIRINNIKELFYCPVESSEFELILS